MRVAQAKANLADIETQLNEMKVVAPGDTVLEILSVKVGDVLAPNREVATLIMPELSLGARLCAGAVARFDQAQRRSARARRFLSERDFRGVVEQINRQAEFTPRNVQTVEDRIRQVFGVKVRLRKSRGQTARRHVGRRDFSRTCRSRNESGKPSSFLASKLFSEMPMIECDGLTKRFGNFTAVDHVSFSVAQRLDLRVSRPERFRQIDRHPDALRHPRADRRHARASAVATSRAKATRSRR